MSIVALSRRPSHASLCSKHSYAYLCSVSLNFLLASSCCCCHPESNDLAAAASAPATVPPPPTAPAAPAPPASSSSSESTERISTGVFDSTGALLFRGDLVTLRTSSKGRFRLLRQFQAGNSAIVHGITFNRDIKIHLPHNPRITTVRAGASVTKST